VRISIKNRCLVIITMLAFIMTSILPGVAQTNSTGREASDISALSSLSGENTNDFMAGGGDAYIMFKEGSNVIDTHQLVREVLIEAIKKVKTIDFKGDDRFQDNGTGAKQQSNLQIYQYKQAAFARAA